MPYNTEIYLYKQWRSKGFNLRSLLMSQLVFSDSFGYLCYGSMAIIDCFIFFSAVTVFRRQNLTSKDAPRAEKGNKF